MALSKSRKINIKEASSLAVNADISDTTLVATYNLDGNKQRAVLIPGFPPVLAKPGGTYSMLRSTDHHSVDANAEANPDYPTEFLFQVVEVCQPSFDFKDVKIITDRNNLRKLLKCFGEAPAKEFSIFVEKVGDVKVFTRYDPPDLKFSQFLGYGPGFESKNTRTEATFGQPKSFHCISRYNLGDIPLLVRSETDAVKQTVSPQDVKTANDRFYVPRQGSGVQHAHVGTYVTKDSHDFYELKTKSSLYADEFDWEDTYYQMVLGLADVLLLGLHNRGYMGNVKEIPLKEVERKFSGNAGKKLGQLNALLKLIIDEVDDMSQFEKHAVFQLKYQREGSSMQLILTELDMEKSKLPKWVIDKLTNTDLE